MTRRRSRREIEHALDELRPPRQGDVDRPDLTAAEKQQLADEIEAMIDHDSLARSTRGGRRHDS